MNASASKCHKAMPNRGALVTGFVTGCDCHTTPLRVRDRWTITAVLPGNHADRAVTRTCVKSVTGRPRGTLAGALSRCHTPFKGVTALRPHVPVAKSHDGVQPRPDQRARSKRKRPATNPRESGPPILAARRAYARAILTELRTNFEEEGLDEWASSEDERGGAGDQRGNGRVGSRVCWRSAIHERRQQRRQTNRKRTFRDLPRLPVARSVRQLRRGYETRCGLLGWALARSDAALKLSCRASKSSRRPEGRRAPRALPCWSHQNRRPRGVKRRSLPAQGSGKGVEIVITKGLYGAPTPPKSQSQTQTLRNLVETAHDPPVSRSAVFASEHHEARRCRCPSCGAAQGQDCTETDSESIRRRGPRWHHRARHAAAVGHDPDRAGERSSNAARMHSAPTARRPRPAPPRMMRPAPAGSLPERLRAVLRPYSRDSDPEAVQITLAGAGLRLSVQSVQTWLDALDDGRRKP